MIKISPVNLKIGNRGVPGNDHVHTWRSDGELTELETIVYASTNNLKRIEWTDHDATKAWSHEVIEEINEYIHNGVVLLKSGKINPKNPKLIRSGYVKHILTETNFDDYGLYSYHRIKEAGPGVLRCGELIIGKGVELTVNMGKTFHILGLTISNLKQDFANRLENICSIRRKRAGEIIDFLYTKDYFFDRTLKFLRSTRDKSFSKQKLKDLIGDKKPITLDDVFAINPNAPSRLTIGFLLWKRYGPRIYGDLIPEEVRDIYLKRSPKSRFTIPTFSPEEGTAMINDCGGIPVLAHPNEGRDPNDDWLTKGFEVLEAEGYDVGKLVEKGIIKEADIRYAFQYGILGLFRKWGIRGVEHKAYAEKYKLMDFSGGTEPDYHGPFIKRERKIRGGAVPSTESLLNLKAVKDAHNILYWKMRSAFEYEKWRKSFERTKTIIDAFPSTSKRSDEQRKIVESMPKELKHIVTIGEYLEMSNIYERNPPYFMGTVLDMGIAVQNQIKQMVETSSYLTYADQQYNERTSSYLKGRLNSHTRLDILVENLPFLHNIGKILTFGVEEVERDEQGRYRTTFVQHDLVGKELIEYIRNVLVEQQGLGNIEVDHIRDVAFYHVNVHNAVYKVMRGLAKEQSIEAISPIIEKEKLKPDVILDSLLLIKAAGKMAYSRDSSQYDPYYIKAIDEVIKVCVDLLNK